MDSRNVKPLENSRFIPEFVNAGFDDSNWNHAIPVIAEKNPLWNAPQSQSRFLPWVNLISSTTAPLRYTRCSPVSILQCGEVLQQRSPSCQDTAIQMSLEPILPLEKASVQNVESLIGDTDGPVTITNSDIQESEDTFSGLSNATVVLDFGRLVNARFGFRLDSSAGSVVDIGYAYRLDNGRVVPYVSYRTAMASQYITCDGLQQWQTFQWYHFRYVQLTFRNLKQPLKLFEVWAEKVEHPFERRGSFKCNDEVVNSVFHASRFTIELCTTDRMMDNPSRERKQYLGDCSGVLPAIWACFGDAAIIRKYFAQADEGQYSTGLYRCAYPGRDYDKEPIFDHSLAVPLRLYEYDLLFDDTEFLERMWPGLLRFMRLVESSISRDGIIEAVPYSIWFDWAHIDRQGCSFVLNAMTCEALRRSASIASRLGYERYVRHWNDFAQTMCALLRENWFDKQRGVFVDSTVDGVQGQHISEHGLSLAILFNIATPRQTLSMTEFYSKNIESFGQTSPTWAYMPACLVRAGRTDLALQWIHRRFEPLLNEGRQTVPETWSLFGEKTIGSWRARNSRAVAQGSGLGVPWTLLSELCGIQPFKPGFETIRFCPQPGLLTQIEGTFPGPDGNYQLSYHQESQGCQLDITIPNKRPIVLDLPFIDVGTAIRVGDTKVCSSEQIAMPNGKLVPRFHLAGESRYSITINS